MLIGSRATKGIDPFTLQVGAVIQLSRDDMAAMVGTAPESLTRTLSEFKQEGLIKLTPRSLRVHEPEKRRRAHW